MAASNPTNSILSLVKSGLDQINMVFNQLAVKRNRVEVALYTTVYKNGADYDTAKNIHYELWKGNRNQFDRIYNEMAALRFSGGEYFLDDQKNKYRNFGIVLLVILIIGLGIMIYKQFKN